MLFSIEGLLLVFALCLDSFAASFAFGVQRIKIPALSAALISFVCTAFLGASLLLGRVMGPLLPKTLATAVAFCILAALGLTRLLDSLVKERIRKSRSGAADLRFRFLSFSFLLLVWSDSTQADRDHSKVLVPREAAPLAVALSLDGLAAGFGAGILQTGLVSMCTAAFLLDLLLIALGAAVGRRVAAKCGLNLSWLGGAVLLVLACLRLI